MVEKKKIKEMKEMNYLGYRFLKSGESANRGKSKKKQ